MTASTTSASMVICNVAVAAGPGQRGVNARWSLRVARQFVDAENSPSAALPLQRVGDNSRQPPGAERRPQPPGLLMPGLIQWRVGQAPQDIGLVERRLTVPGQIDQRAKAGFFRQLSQRQTRQTQSRR